LVIIALKEIGKGKVSDEHLKMIYEALKNEKQENIQHDSNLAPVWISNIIEKLVRNE
jgi:hypothetical protein